MLAIGEVGYGEKSQPFFDECFQWPLPSVLPDVSASVKWFPALVQVSQMAVLP